MTIQSILRRRTAARRRGLTLLELVVVLTILVALGAMVVPVLRGSGEQSSETTTDATLIAVRDALLHYWSDTKYVVLTGDPAVEDQRFQVRWLFENPSTSDTFDPDTRIGWNGPYLVNQTGRYTVDVARGFRNQYGTETTNELEKDPAVVDSWTASPIIIQATRNTNEGYWDIRIVSAGPDGVVDLDSQTLTENLTPATSGDDVYVALKLR